MSFWEKEEQCRAYLLDIVEVFRSSFPSVSEAVVECPGDGLEYVNSRESWMFFFGYNRRLSLTIAYSSQFQEYLRQKSNSNFANNAYQKNGSIQHLLRMLLSYT